MTIPYIVFDRGKIETLAAEFDASIVFTLELLPRINWNSPQQIKAYFAETFSIQLVDVKIKTLDAALKLHEHDPEIVDVLTGALQFFRLKATLNNYLMCILRHLDGDKLLLRDVDGVWMMPNKQPIFHFSEVWECVISLSSELKGAIPDDDKFDHLRRSCS